MVRKYTNSQAHSKQRLDEPYLLRFSSNWQVKQPTMEQQQQTTILRIDINKRELGSQPLDDTPQRREWKSTAAALYSVLEFKENSKSIQEKGMTGRLLERAVADGLARPKPLPPLWAFSNTNLFISNLSSNHEPVPYFPRSPIPWNAEVYEVVTS